MDSQRVPTTTPGRGDTATPLSVAGAVGGFAMALFGVYWDDAWHTDRGRDELLSPPHLALYAGVALAVAVVAWWAWRRRSSGWRSVLSGPIGVAIAGAAVTLASAPVDEWWHVSFGRDAVLWSPPHLIALVGTIALGSGVVLVAGQATSTSSPDTRISPWLVVAAGVGVMGAWQVLVLEYDTDVAQFSPLWYLPILAVGTSVSASTVQAAIGDRLRWSATWTGLAYTLAMAGLVISLGSMGFSTPIVPAILPATLVADLTRNRGWRVFPRALAFVAVLFLTYVPYLRVVPGGVAPTNGQIAVGFVMGVVAVMAAIPVFDPRVRLPRISFGRRTMTAMVAMTALFLGAGSAPAVAHDPGQGPEIVDIELVATVTDRRVTITGSVAEPTAGIEPRRVVARRAGRLVDAPLVETGGPWTGQVELDEDGRWFVYVEASRGDETLEAWLPVVVGRDDGVSKDTSLYLSSPDDGPTVAQILTGALLFTLSVLIIARVALAVRRSSLSTAATPPVSSTGQAMGTR